MSDIRLFALDLDGTLLDDPHGGVPASVAYTRAVEEVFGITVDPAAFRRPGSTACALLRDILRGRGIDPTLETSRIAEVWPLALEFAHRDVASFRTIARPGAVDLLEAINDARHLPALATGNAEGFAAFKVELAGLQHLLVRKDGVTGETRILGGYGDTASTRAHLVLDAQADAARAVGSAFPSSRTIVLDDTPLGIQSAHHTGSIAVGVATEAYSVAELTAAGADLVVPSFIAPGAITSILHVERGASTGEGVVTSLSASHLR